MKLDITSIIKNNGATIEFSQSEELMVLNAGLGTVKYSSPVVFTGQITNNNGMLNLTGEAQVDYITACDRCGQNLEKHLTVNVVEDILEKDSSESTEEDSEKADDRFTFSGHILELDRIVTDNILLNMSMQHLCRDDCEGLCYSCGSRIKDQQCDCNKTQTVDPRLESLKNYFER